MYVIHDALNAWAGHFEPDGRVRCPSIGTTAENDNHRLAVHFTQCQFPRPWPAIVIEEIGRFRKLPCKSFGNVQPRVGTDQFAHSSPIAAVEALDVKLHHSFQLWAHTSSWFRMRRRLGQLRSSPIQRRLDTANSRVDQICNFLKRIVKNILQKNARALFRRQR
jgi:hypothetical protein